MTRQVEYVGLLELLENPANAKLHSTEGINTSLDRFGTIELPVIDDRTGMILAGHGRVETLLERYARGDDPPEGIRVDPDTDAWLVPVVTGWASADDDEATAAGIALNAYVERGGWTSALPSVLQGLMDGPGLTGIGFGPADLTGLMKRAEAWDPETGGDSNARRESSIDELAAGYRHKDVRTLVLDYPLDEFTEVRALADAARKTHNVEGNAELLMALLRRWDAAHPEEQP